MKLLNDTNQPEAYRIWAAVGLGRMLLLPVIDLPTKQRQDIVAALIAALNRDKGGAWWLQMRQVEALGQCNISSDSAGRPIVLQTLGEILADKDRPWIVRAEAAQAIGRIPIDKKVDYSVLVSQIIRLGQQMADEAVKDPRKSDWGLCFFKLYLAFKPANADEQKKGYGLLNKGSGQLGAHQKTIDDAYKAILPMLTQVIADITSNKPLNLAGHAARLGTWLQANEPKESKIAPNEKPLAAK